MSFHFMGQQSQLSAAFPSPFQLSEPASQKFPCPFPLTTAPLLIPGRGLRDGDFSVANLLSLFTETLSPCQLKFSPKGVGIAPRRVGSCLFCSTSSQSSDGAQGGAPLSGSQPV